MPESLLNDDPYAMEVLERDRELFDRELRSFVVPGSFDAHGHLYDAAFDVGPGGERFIPDGHTAITRRLYDTMVGGWMGDRLPRGGLFFPYPHRGTDVMGQNRWIGDQVRSDPHSRALLLLTPDCDPAAHERLLADPTFVGFKVYHCFADCADTFHADCGQFMPEWMWELADRRGLAIMLHMVKVGALCDESNQRYIRDHCLRYPGAKLILAHCGRSFCSRTTVDGVAALRGLDNVWFDNSAICEAAPHEAILRVFGPTRLFFALDHPISSMRARCITIGDGFAWTNEIEPRWERSRFGRPVLVGIENLLALKQACHTLGLADRDVEEIFGNAARRLFGLDGGGPRVDVQEQYREAKQIIPGGTQLLSKRPEQFAPGQWPAYYEEARGCEVVDTEGRRFIDFSAGGILACILGFADPDVNVAVIRRVHL